MKANVVPYLAGVVVLGAAGWALVHKEEPAAEPAPPAALPPAATAQADLPNGGVLPPNHPPIGDMQGMQGSTSPHGMGGPMPPGAAGAAGDDDPAITWTAPAAWQVAPNPSPMRIATYRPSPAVDVSVSRAGGATDANIDRWVHQFDAASAPKRSDTKVKGIDVHVVDVSGTYQGGGMMGGAPEAHPSWSLVGAIVETRGAHYFFKMIGPSPEVAAARKGFDSLIQGITPH